MLAAEGSTGGEKSPQKTSDPQKPSEQQLNRACERCRLSKVRCLVDAGSSQCQRCTKAKRTCIFAAPQKRRQRKRTDVRVAELEREVRQMRALLKASRISPGAPGTEELDESDNSESDDPVSTPDPAPEMPWVSVSVTNTSQPCGAAKSDIIARGIISIDMAQEFLDLYRNKLCDFFPGTLIPSECTVNELRESKPVLFLSIMAAASQTKGAELSKRIFEELLRVYADRMFIKGEKSVEFVQALLNTINFYSSPGSQANIQFYQYSNMAATMALEIGIATKPRTQDHLPTTHIPNFLAVSSTDGLLENCRTILLCYLLTAGLAMRLRRPNMLVFNSWMAECMSLLETSAIFMDRQICAWVRLQRIADETTTAFGFDDASTSFTLTELRMQVVLREFERKMDSWMRTTPREILNLSMRISYQQNIISMWDFAIDEGKHDAPNFRNKYFTLPELDPNSSQYRSKKPLKSLQINATLKCMSAAQEILDEFLTLSIEDLRVAPNVFFVRVCFALVVLLKADYALATNEENLSKLMDGQSDKLDYYMSTILNHVSEAIGPQQCHVPRHWVHVVRSKVLPWHKRYREIRRSQRASPQSAVDSHSTKSNIDTSSGASPSGAFVAFPGKTVLLSSPASNDVSASVPATTEGHDKISFSAPSGSISQTAYDESQWDFLANDTTFPSGQQAFPTDMSTLFDQGDLYFWDDAMDLGGSWMPPGTDFNDMQPQYPPHGS